MRTLPLLLALFACKAEEVERATDASVCEGGPSRVAVVEHLVFGRQEPVGVGPGFDLDGLVSSVDDSSGCNKADLVSPDGSLEGIDSAFSALVPVLEATEAAAVEGLIQDSIRSGELLLAIELTGIDDEVDDDCINAQMVRADGIPMIGTDGNLLDAQTFERHPVIAAGQTTEAWIEDNVFEARGLTMGLELQVLDEYLEFQVTRGAIRGELHPDGRVTGEFAGGIPVQQIVDEFDLGDIDIADLIATAVPAAADLQNPDTGECDAISITFQYEAVGAYLFD